jgi:hypothetical protein
MLLLEGEMMGALRFHAGDDIGEQLLQDTVLTDRRVSPALTLQHALEALEAGDLSHMLIVQEAGDL